jgi:hypothetical protein
LRVTPAQAAGLTTKLWEVEDLARLIEEDFSTQNLPIAKLANLSNSK